MAGSRILAKGRETEKFTQIDYPYTFLNKIIIELPQMYMQLPQQR